MNNEKYILELETLLRERENFLKTPDRIKNMPLLNLNAETLRNKIIKDLILCLKGEYAKHSTIEQMEAVYLQLIERRRKQGTAKVLEGKESKEWLAIHVERLEGGYHCLFGKDDFKQEQNIQLKIV